jgi:hypothetical protein
MIRRPPRSTLVPYPPLFLSIADFLELAQPVLIHVSSAVAEVINDNYAMTVSITSTGSESATIAINTADGIMSCSGALNTPLVFTFIFDRKANQWTEKAAGGGGGTPLLAVTDSPNGYPVFAE